MHLGNTVRYLKIQREQPLRNFVFLVRPSGLRLSSNKFFRYIEQPLTTNLLNCKRISRVVRDNSAYLGPYTRALLEGIGHDPKRHRVYDPEHSIEFLPKGVVDHGHQLVFRLQLDPVELETAGEIRLSEDVEVARLKVHHPSVPLGA
jgi:hypothetical protein